MILAGLVATKKTKSHEKSWSCELKQRCSFLEAVSRLNLLVGPEAKLRGIFEAGSFGYGFGSRFDRHFCAVSCLFVATHPVSSK
jgi:hypothetical protein